MPNQMSQKDASRIQNMKLNITKAQGGKNMSSGGFAARAQSAGDRNANSGYAGSGGSGSQGSSGGQQQSGKKG
ncbi:hypothetical protein LIA77_11984 [Sarocladium implicatum]|nr:hypothetical protein LIA77_11984 [Sarocladium implicatum]